jgi:hypothetical protein
VTASRATAVACRWSRFASQPARIALSDQGLQPGLLVQADLEVREHEQLRARFRIGLGACPLVARERLSEVPLALGRVAGAKARGRLRLGQVLGEDEADLREDREVAARDRVARPLDRVERRVQLGGQTAEPRARPQQAAAEQRAPQRRERVHEPAPRRETALEVGEEIFAANRRACLPRRPGRVAAPVRARAGPGRHGHREPRVALRDLEVPDHRVRERDDPPDVGRARCGCAFHARSVPREP